MNEFRAPDEQEPAWQQAEEPQYFRDLPRPERIPNFGHVMVLFLITLASLIAVGLLCIVALQQHWFGLTSITDLQHNTGSALGSQAIIYLLMLTGAALSFPPLWHTSFLNGLHWRGDVALRLRSRLILIGIGCDIFAVVIGALTPFPKHAPIDEMFNNKGAAWLLFAFGITLAPFFEEMIFRGFLLPALATSWDWTAEKIAHRTAPPLDQDGHPKWSIGAQIFAALTVSAPFALMHGAQLGGAIWPLVLLYCISLVLSAVRLRTRSLACSTLVHASYNFTLFAVMLAQSGGFQHMDKL